MYKRTSVLQPPESFSFPFVPYQIQHDFMSNLYRVIENRKIGIFESPTGTGKSLSLTCGALRWLIDADTAIKKEITDKIERLKKDSTNNIDGSSMDWITSQYAAIQLKEELMTLKKIAESIQEYDRKMLKLKEEKKKQRNERRKQFRNNNKLDPFVGENETETGEIDEDDLLLVFDGAEQREDDDIEEVRNEWKGNRIFFCSRTHSQLSQVINEVKGTVYGSMIRAVSLASRQNYCINPAVKKLESNSLINERCLDLQKNQKKKLSEVDQAPAKKLKKSETKCPFFSQNTISILKDDCLSEIMDIEELTQAGRTIKGCPYYASRMAAKDAQIILLPYQMLLHEKTRQQSGLDITDSIIIIDEAHNLIDAISNIYSAEITIKQLNEAHRQLIAYKTKYFARFETKTLLKINQLIFILNRLIKILENGLEGQSRMVQTIDLMIEAEFFNIKINEILSFAEQSRLAQKVHGFNLRYPADSISETTDNSKTDTKSYLRMLAEKQKENKKKKCEIKITTVSDQNENKKKLIVLPSVIRPVLAFLECFMRKSDNGRVLITHSENVKLNSSMKYLLLDAGSQFNELLKQCRALIVAGGTMQPTDDFINQLFNNDKHRVDQYFFDHVVPKESVLPLVVGRGPSNVQFSFTFANRNNKEMLAELAMTLRNICNVVPAGVVCFFVSYDYMDLFYNYLCESDHLMALNRRKEIFKEPKNSSQIEKMLSEYSVAARQISKDRNGSLLFSVIGGKLSEGLNFSDDLGRCVIVVGMPYPNKYNPELAEKLKYLNKMFHGKAGDEYYENLCMKAVNQCIGRAVRHINDYASVILLDERYSQEKIRKKLPKWINDSLKCANSYGMVQGSLAKFFREKKLSKS